MRQISRIVYLMILGIAIALPAGAQQRDLPRQPPGEPMHGMMQGGMMGMMGMMGAGGDAAGRERPQLTLALQHRAELGLNEPQGKTLETLVERFRSTTEQRMRELEAAETELGSLLKQEPTAGQQVEAQVRRIEKLRADLRLERIRTIAEGRAALAPEQRAKLDQLLGSSAGGRMGMHGSMEGMDHGAHHGSTRPERKQ